MPKGHGKKIKQANKPNFSVTLSLYPSSLMEGTLHLSHYDGLLSIPILYKEGRGLT